MVKKILAAALVLCAGVASGNTLDLYAQTVGANDLTAGQQVQGAFDIFAKIGQGDIQVNSAWLTVSFNVATAQNWWNPTATYKVQTASGAGVDGVPWVAYDYHTVFEYPLASMAVLVGGQGWQASSDVSAPSRSDTHIMEFYDVWAAVGYETVYANHGFEGTFQRAVMDVVAQSRDILHLTGFFGEFQASFQLDENARRSLASTGALSYLVTAAAGQASLQSIVLKIDYTPVSGVPEPGSFAMAIVGILVVTSASGKSSARK
jgi:hypothetical protein